MEGVISLLLDMLDRCRGVLQMADWIKMRSGLLTNPKVTKMARTLLANPEFLEWYGNPEVTNESSQTVTMRHVTVVTRVVVGGLLPVWTAVNESVGRDGHLRHAGLFEVDVMSGIPGFGAAMAAVDWLTELPDDEGLEFANFIEHNTVEQERSTHAKTAAERAKEYRDRKALEKSGTVTNGVTKKCDASRDTVTTEESRREEISSSLRSEDSAAKPQRTPSRPKREEATLAKYLENCKAAGVKPVPDGHAIRTWCEEAKIPTDMLQVAWVVFREKYLNDEKLKGKRYKDWAAHFATSVKDRWYGLWFTGEDGNPAWTHTGLQRKQVLEAQHSKSQKEVTHEPA